MDEFDLNVFREDVLNTIRESILVLDLNFNIIYANSSYCDAFKISTDEIKNKPLNEISNGQWNIPSLTKLLVEVLPKKRIITDYKIQHTFPKVGKRILLLNGRRLEDRKGKEKFIFLSIEDITEKTKILEASLHANKLSMIGQLSAGIAHGLSSPLTVIHNFIEVYAKTEPKDSSRYEEYELMLNACDYMQKLVKNLTYFARTTKHDFSRISWADIIDSTLIFTERQFTASNIFIEKDISKDIKEINGNKGQLQQVFLNLLINSKEAITHSGKITISVKNIDEDKCVFFELTDSGIGISKKDLLHVFEPFFTTKKVKNGSGLGLSAAYGIIKDHNGSIHIESVEGQGTKVIIKIPYAK